VDVVEEAGVAVVAVAAVEECGEGVVAAELAAAVEVIVEVGTGAVEAAVRLRCRDHRAGHHR
jgi:hypothetical protein